LSHVRRAAFVALVVAIDAAAARADVAAGFVLRQHGAAATVAWALLRVVAAVGVALLLLARRRAFRVGSFVLLSSLFVAHFAMGAANGAGVTRAAVRLALSDGQYAGGALRLFLLPAVVRAALAVLLVRLLWVAAHRFARPARELNAWRSEWSDLRCRFPPPRPIRVPTTRPGRRARMPSKAECSREAVTDRLRT
jgi:hypothetical protein